MLDRISFEIRCVNTEVLKKALFIHANEEKFIFSDTEDEYFVLRPSQTKYKKITDALVSKYRALLTEGEIVYPKNSLRGLPADKALRFEYISDICKSMRRVIVAQEGTVPRSDSWFLR